MRESINAFHRRRSRQRRPASADHSRTEFGLRALVMAATGYTGQARWRPRKNIVCDAGVVVDRAGIRHTAHSVKPPNTAACSRSQWSPCVRIRARADGHVGRSGRGSDFAPSVNNPKVRGRNFDVFSGGATNRGGPGGNLAVDHVNVAETFIVARIDDPPAGDMVVHRGFTRACLKSRWFDFSANGRKINAAGPPAFSTSR